MFKPAEVVKHNRSIYEWRVQGMEQGFKSYGYGKFAHGVPCSIQFRGKTKLKGGRK